MLRLFLLTEVIPLALADVAEAGLLPLIPLGFDTGNGFSKLAVGFGIKIRTSSIYIL